VLLTAEYPGHRALNATAHRFNYQFDKSPARAPTRTCTDPVCSLAEVYLMPDHQGLFGAAELGMFDLIVERLDRRNFREARTT